MGIKNNKIRNTKGFTLIETLIGLMILTIAIVSATSLLIGLIQSNKQIVKTLQAHYLAQEGLEAVRNIRDTNWMNNKYWRKEFGEGDLPTYTDPIKYVIGLNEMTFHGGSAWSIDRLKAGNNIVYLCGVSRDNQYFSSVCGGPDKLEVGTRDIEISKPKYCEKEDNPSDLKDLCDSGKVMLVKSVVKFDKGEVTLGEILTDWKGGAL